MFAMHAWKPAQVQSKVGQKTIFLACSGIQQNLVIRVSGHGSSVEKCRKINNPLYSRRNPHIPAAFRGAVKTGTLFPENNSPQ